MAISLDALITEVEQRSASTEPLALLATASSTVNELSDTTDALLSHFVDRSRRAGHSWSEIGEALGVTKQAVQKRFTGEKQWLRGSHLLTDRAKATVTKHAEAAAKELQQSSIGTEALLLGIWDEPKGLAAKFLKEAGVNRAKTLATIVPHLPTGANEFAGGYTPRAWKVLESLISIAATMGHNYIGTEHVLIGLLRGEDHSVATRSLDDLGVTVEGIVDALKKVINGISS